MKNKGKGIVSFICSLLVIAAVSVIAIVGIGSKKYGSASDIKLGLDLAGGVSITYEAVKENPTEEEMSDTLYKMQKRAEVYSTESNVYLEGSNRINVDIPSVTDANAVLEELGNAGAIYFIVGKNEDGTANIAYDSTSKSGYKLARPLEEIIADGDVVIEGSDIAGAEPKAYNDGMKNEYIVSLTLNESGTKKFAAATKKAYSYYSATSIDFRNLIAIVYDGKVQSAPRVQAEITGGIASISGQSTYTEAQQLASTIRIGALPLELKEIRSNVVGARLGEEAINTSLIAGAIGFALVLLFMIVYYRIPGLAASIALTLYVGLIVICLNIFNVTLTLPGVAGIILSIGMAVDANVIIFTRIREELATGKTARSAIKLGFDKALSAIVDGNVTTLIAAAVLYFLGSGTVKGFAQTLAIGIILSMITALFVTKFILKALFDMGCDSEKFYGVQKEVKIFDFVGHAKTFFAISIVVILVGIGALFVNKANIGDILNYGLDFKGGASTQVTFPEELPSTINVDLEALVSSATGLTAEISRISGENSVIIKTSVLDLDQKKALEDALVEKYNVDTALITTENISGTVSSEMKSDAIKAVVIATICMLIYIWIRFKNFEFASSAVIALVHDVLVVLMVYAVARISVGNTFIACMLTIVGYSINATIVIFDRIRENMKAKLRKDAMKDVVNASISQTISRSINTSLTTFIMVFVLAILGVDSIKEFAYPLMAGIIAGAYSSVCITSCLWYMLQKRFGGQE
ncbi:MAG: protein translocase subunit SecD [Lachnospiraceae bacterium]|nr:protein translocase subunit SecD [Lachnospiraceae bacterium]